MTYLLQLRLKQVYRALREVGWLLLVLVAPILLVSVLSILETAQQSGSPVLAMVVLVLIFLLHTQRNDAGFLRLLNFSPRIIFLIEYSIAVIPFSLLAAFSLKDWTNPMIMQLGAILIALLPAGLMQRWQAKAGVNLNWIPNRFFEFKCMFRQQYIWITLVYLTGLAFCFFTGSMPLVGILLSLVAASTYDSIENHELLELTVAKKNWLPRKAIQQIKVFQLVMTPHYLLFLLFHHQYWYIMLAIIVISSSLITFALAYKYAHYYPRRQKANNQLPTSFFMLFLIVPFFAPACLVYLWVYWRRATKNMNLYRNGDSSAFK